MSYLDLVFFADNMDQSGSLEPTDSSLQPTDSSLQPTGSSTQPVAPNTTGDSNQPVASGSNSWRARYSDSAVSKFLLDALDSLDVSLFLDSFNSIVGLILVALTVVMF